MGKKDRASSIFFEIVKLFRFLKETHVSMTFLYISVALSVIVTFFNLYTVSLLFPLVDGLIKSDFSRVQNLSFMKSIVARAPGIFSNSFALFVFLVAWIYMTIIIKNSIAYLSMLTMIHQADRTSSKLRERIFDRYLSLGKSFYDKSSISTLNNVLVNSTKSIEMQLKTLHNSFTHFLLFVVFLMMMLHISWQLTLIVLTVFTMVNYEMHSFTTKIKNASLKYTKSLNVLSNRIATVLSGIMIVKGYGKESEERAWFSEASENEIRQSFKIHRMTSLTGPIQDISSNTALLLVALGMALLKAKGSAPPAAEMFVFFFLIKRIVPTFTALNDMRVSVARAAGPIAELEGVLNRNEEHIVPEGNQAFGGLKKGIEFRNANFFYNKKTPVLRAVSFFIEKGKMTALVGQTGAGKTTIANLLLRFYDCPPSSIWMDDVDIRDLSVRSLRERMAFVSQDAILFDDSIRSNICYASRSDVPDGHFMEIAKKARVHDFAIKLPEQFMTRIGEQGTKLSGGEKQRISIARALVKDAEILILDEPTSSLDLQTEALITEGIRDLIKDKTVLVIAHRLSTIKDADKIVVIESGTIVEQGTLDELIARNGAFCRYWERQKL